MLGSPFWYTKTIFIFNNSLMIRACMFIPLCMDHSYPTIIDVVLASPK